MGGAIFHSNVETKLKSAKNVVFSIFCLPMWASYSPHVRWLRYWF